MSPSAHWPFSPRLNRALDRIDRARFIPEKYRKEAQGDYPLPIGHGQTISQPSLVAYMTEELGLPEDARVLDVGTGSGYQTAILAEVCAEVYSIEVVPTLAQSARKLLGEIGYKNIRFRIGDGHAGWPEAAPFDGIVVSAAAETVPAALLEQLAPGGRMVIPVGPPGGEQRLLRFEKTTGGFERRELLDVRFVPLIST